MAMLVCQLVCPFIQYISTTAGQIDMGLDTRGPQRVRVRVRVIPKDFADPQTFRLAPPSAQITPG